MKRIAGLIKSTRPMIFDKNARNNITEKGIADYVTEVDINVQTFLREELKKMYPEVRFIGEEGTDREIEYDRPAWILDPVDGTTNLIHDYRHSCVSLGYYSGSEIEAGIIYDPFFEEMFAAVRGKGAYLNGEKIRVSSNSALCDCLVAFGTSPYKKELAGENFRAAKAVFERASDVRRSGSAALDLAYVACGRTDGYFERDLKPWDFAAGSLIVKEAGGCVSDFSENELSVLENQDILASNGKVHTELCHVVGNDYH
ncbi:MAG: inositol monophosphatase [Clostridiales bacterium]|nr:inositol monophosphatase [Clostridiales bacterium]